MHPNSVVVALAVVFGVTAAQAEEFRSSDLRAANNPSVQAVVYMGKLVRERTRGRHTIKMLPQATSTDDFTIQQVKRGSLAMARVGIAAFHNLVPATVVPSLPFVFKSKQHQRQVLDGPIGQEILADMEDEGFIGLGFYDVGARSFYSAKKPIRTAADMKGLSVQVQSGDILTPLLQAMGAVPKQIPYPRLYDSFRVGAVDAGEFDLPTSVIYHREIWDEYEPSARKAAEAAGMELIVDVDRKSFADVMVPARTKFATDPRQKELLSRLAAGSPS